MKEHLRPAVQDAGTLDEVLEVILETFGRMKLDAGRRIGYVAGIITSDGPEQVEVNFQRLAVYTTHLKNQHRFPMISATEVFDDVLLQRIRAGGATHEHFIIFWRKILQSGHITDVFMTPRWEESAGARDEHETAKTLRLRIHYVEEVDF